MKRIPHSPENRLKLAERKRRHRAIGKTVVVLAGIATLGMIGFLVTGA